MKLNSNGVALPRKVQLLHFLRLPARLELFSIVAFCTFPKSGDTMTENVEDLTVNYEEDGVVVVKEIDKEILSKGAWTTILFRYRDYDSSTQQYSADKFSIRRYQKRNGQYQTKSKFNISSAAQAEKIVETLSRWLQSSK